MPPIPSAEIVAAHGLTDKRRALVSPQGGVLWNEATQTDLLFVTLEKSDWDYSPTTRYADYPISPTLFHWESQNTASPDTPTGHRYVEQPARGTNVILFVRERKRDGRGETLPYHCLGRARYRSHESERPMKILWELERPMPGWLYQAGKWSRVEAFMGGCPTAPSPGLPVTLPMSCWGRPEGYRSGLAGDSRSWVCPSEAGWAGSGGDGAADWSQPPCAASGLQPVQGVGVDDDVTVSHMAQPPIAQR